MYFNRATVHVFHKHNFTFCHFLFQYVNTEIISERASEATMVEFQF